MKKILYLHLKGKYFDQTKAGTKVEEYRRCSTYWQNRLFHRAYDYDEIHIMKGYPKKNDHTRRLIFPWNGYKVKVITHPEFGSQPVAVCAIKLKT